MNFAQLFHFLLLFQPQFFALINPIMIINWGAPVNATSCRQQNPLIVWDKCVVICQAIDDCLVAFHLNDVCHICRFQTIRKIQKIDGTNRVPVAYKVDMPTSQCPIDAVNPPTFGNQPVQGVSHVRGEVTYSAEISFVGDHWLITYKHDRECLSSWVEFQRVTGPYKICYEKRVELIKKLEAVEKCKEMNSMLTGFDTMEEFQYFETTLSDGWVDGERSVICNITSFNNNPNCAFIKAFQFNDPYLTKREGYKFRGGEPSGNSEECSYAESLALASPDKVFGVDDRCGVQAMHGYYCGKPA